jgi:hypothetical protein
LLGGKIRVLYVYTVTGILLLIVYLMPKHMFRKDIYIIWFSVSFMEITLDIYLALILDLYYFVGDKSVSPEALALKLIMAPLFGVIFINFMPKKFLRFIPYWIGCAAFSTFFEWTTVVSGYLTYTGWKLWYSGVFYVLVCPLFRLHYKYIKH